MMSSHLHIVILTGAGVSAESGVPTFRGPDGLWEGHPVEEVATPEAFARDPDLVHRFYNQRRASLDTVEPNPAHRALARLGREYPGEVTLVTQNVDDLHARAGSDPLAMHGELRKVRCTECGSVRRWTGELGTETVCPHCGRAGGMRPHIVWFWEEPFHLEAIAAAVRRCDLFAAIGTSGLVYPAAGLAAEARAAGAHCIEFNIEATGTSPHFHEYRTGPAGETVPPWVRELL